MSINATSSSAASSASSTAQVSSAANSENAKKTSADSSFKKEMDKVSSSESEAKTDKKDSANSDDRVNAVDNNTDKDNDSNSGLKDDKQFSDSTNELFNQQNMTLEGNIDYSKFASMSMNDVNSMLSNDIQQMMNTNNSLSPLSDLSAVSKNSGLMSLDFSNSISMTQSDADFFINLTQKNDVSMQNIVAQAQNMVNNGAETKEVKQNMQVSQTLLNALSNSRETNQPVRIDFDQNVSVILRVNKDGVISANFIPGDKAVEQYLRTNIDSLKATFAENDLPYSDLSYSNRGSKQQKENRRNNK